MSPNRTVQARRWLLTTLLFPLLSLGPCGELAARSLINGVFDAVNPRLIDSLGDQLGLDPTDPNVP
jgi:hypothetical protein